MLGNRLFGARRGWARRGVREGGGARAALCGAPSVVAAGQPKRHRGRDAAASGCRVGFLALAALRVASHRSTGRTPAGCRPPQRSMRSDGLVRTSHASAPNAFAAARTCGAIGETNARSATDAMRDETRRVGGMGVTCR
ncbi:hypothetical protein OCJ37_05980 [Xanthomonas sp. AM6]|uniref:hypothetical protein n=1 Tax=Xanthomonas sp. AM6 TaxID=2982531 RepID=UPI0021DAAFCD|nr:hypothetical protein [Xanthomonas sp. AM6]UYB53494.1 hypothetical protein OCJ37_05980 [Xanthomonas sp. AM6]